MNNNPQSISELKALAGTTWAQGDSAREVTRIENVETDSDNTKIVSAEVYWRKPGGKERSNPTSIATFRTWLAKATLVDSEQAPAVAPAAKTPAPKAKAKTQPKAAPAQGLDASKTAYGVWFAKLSNNDVAPRGKCRAAFIKLRQAG